MLSAPVIPVATGIFTAVVSLISFITQNFFITSSLRTEDFGRIRTLFFNILMIFTLAIRFSGRETGLFGFRTTFWVWEAPVMAGSTEWIVASSFSLSGSITVHSSPVWI